MYSPPFGPRPAHRQVTAGLYQQVGIETAVVGASPHHLVAMLFDGFLEAVAQARGALLKNDVQAKALALQRALRIVEEGLRGGLDLQSGGTLARDLDELYGYLSMRLTLANLRNDDAALQECQTLVTPLRDAWQAIRGQADAARG
jgi:flagellar protein FliS